MSVKMKTNELAYTFLRPLRQLKTTKNHQLWPTEVLKDIWYILSLVNIYFVYYELAECSISWKFYETHLEVFKSLQ